MTAPKFTPATAYGRCIHELDGLIDLAEDLDLDEIAVESLRTAIHAMWVQPELYEALQKTLDLMTQGAIKSPLVMHPDKPWESFYYVIERALTKARGESNG